MVEHFVGGDAQVATRRQEPNLSYRSLAADEWRNGVHLRHCNTTIQAFDFFFAQTKSAHPVIFSKDRLPCRLAYSNSEFLSMVEHFLCVRARCFIQNV